MADSLIPWDLKAIRDRDDEIERLKEELAEARKIYAILLCQLGGPKGTERVAR